MNIALVEGVLAVVTESTGFGGYDFDLELHFRCSHPILFETPMSAIMRLGAIEDYPARCEELRSWGLEPIQTPEHHRLASELECWYPRLSDLTPRTRVYESLPGASEVEAEFDWPVFLKGSRQTSRHDPELSIIRNREHWERVAPAYRSDPILRWQKPAIREYVPLLAVPGDVPGKVRPSLEFRSFWWRGQCVAVGRYWYQVPPYEADDLDAGLRLAATAAARLEVPFLVVDFAKRCDGEWILIECNDAQESGYAGAAPGQLWRKILNLCGT